MRREVALIPGPRHGGSRRRGGLRALGWATALLLLSSCISLPIPDRMTPTRGETLAWKVVAEKRDPDLLVASDRTHCVVGRDRFDEVQEGDRVFCQWR